MVNAAIIVGSIKKRIEDKDKNNSYSSSSSSTTINTSSTATEKQESAASIWKDTANDLDRFWNEISTSTWWLNNDLFEIWWNGWNSITKTNIQNYKSFLKEKKKFWI